LSFIIADNLNFQGLTMTLSCQFSQVYKPVKSPLPLSAAWLFCLVLFSSIQAEAATLSVQVTNGLGGRIAAAPGDVDCAFNCLISVKMGAVSSLFAIADKGYRFQAWEGACANTLGPLCTIKVGGDAQLGARFVKAETSKKPVKALLLLHGEDARQSVWNEFVRQRFDDRCPVVYGGVVLGDDSHDPENKVYCYRIAFGYYDMLKQQAAPVGLEKSGDRQKTKKTVPGKFWNHEIRAAVLGLLARHPNLNLTLLGQSRAAVAAQSFLLTNTVESSHVIGLLNLRQAGQAFELTQPNADQAQRVTVLNLMAKPDQDAKISTALAQLTKSWWLNP